MCPARQACHAVHLAANVDSANAITGDPLTSMHTATATSTAGQGPRATPLSTKLGGTAPAGSLPSSSCWRMSRAGAAHTSTEAPARDTQAIMASFRQCNSHADGGEHFSGGPAHSRPPQVWSGLVGRVSVVLSLMHLLIQNGETVETHGQQAAQQTPL